MKKTAKISHHPRIQEAQKKTIFTNQAKYEHQENRQINRQPNRQPNHQSHH